MELTEKTDPSREQPVAYQRCENTAHAHGRCGKVIIPEGAMLTSSRTSEDVPLVKPHTWRSEFDLTIPDAKAKQRHAPRLLQSHARNEKTIATNNDFNEGSVWNHGSTMAGRLAG